MNYDIMATGDVTNFNTILAVLLNRLGGEVVITMEDIARMDPVIIGIMTTSTIIKLYIEDKKSDSLDIQINSKNGEPFEYGDKS